MIKELWEIQQNLKNYFDHIPMKGREYTTELMIQEDIEALHNEHLKLKDFFEDDIRTKLETLMEYKDDILEDLKEETESLLGSIEEQEKYLADHHGDEGNDIDIILTELEDQNQGIKYYANEIKNEVCKDKTDLKECLEAIEKMLEDL